MNSCAILYTMVLKITMFFNIYAVTLLSLELLSKVLCRRLSLKLCVDRVFKQKIHKQSTLALLSILSVLSVEKKLHGEIHSLLRQGF